MCRFVEEKPVAKQRCAKVLAATALPFARGDRGFYQSGSSTLWSRFGKFAAGDSWSAVTDEFGDRLPHNKRSHYDMHDLYPVCTVRYSLRCIGLFVVENRVVQL